MKNGICHVLSGQTVDESATSVDIGGCCLVAKCSLNIRNNKSSLVRILPTGLQLIGKSHFVDMLLLILGMFFANSPFFVSNGDYILQANKQTDDTLFSFVLQAVKLTRVKTY